MSRRSNLRNTARRNNRARNRADHSLSLYRRPLRLEPLEDRRLLALVTVTTDQDVVDFNDGVTSLREAIFATNTVPGADTIDFDFGHDGPATILLTQGELTITDSLTIDGPGADLLTIDASGNDPTPDLTNYDGSRVFLIGDGDFEVTTQIDVALSGLRLTGGDLEPGRQSWPGWSGGAIAASANLTLASMSIVGNSAFLGGGISIYQGTLQLIGSDVSGNVAFQSGGGIDARHAEVSIESSAISSNHSYDSGRGGGGGIRFGVGKLTINGSLITGNEAGDVGRHGRGAGLLVDPSNSDTQLEIRHSTISGNSGAQVGGGIWADARTGPILIEDSTIAENSASQAGGGIYLDIRGGNVTIRGSIISGNSAHFGGGIYSYANSGSLLIEKTSVTGNSVIGPFGDGDGGGIALAHRPDAAATIRNATIADNTAQGHGRGGGIVVSLGGLSIDQSTISGNSAGAGGGIFVAQNASAQLAHSTVALNEASDAGSGIYLREGELGLDHSIVAANFGGAGGDLTAVTTSPIDARYSLIGYNASDLEETPVSVPDANGNLIGGALHGAIDPLVAPLADNGGPILPDGSHLLTHALLPGSPAINRGDLNAVAGIDGVPLYDERGEPFDRIFGGRIDIGAFEYQQASDLNLLVDTLADVGRRVPDIGRGNLSLRNAISLANFWPGSDTIHFDPALTADGPANLLMNGAYLQITDPISIVGPGAALLTIDGAGSNGIFRIWTNSADVVPADTSISGLTLTGANGAQGFSTISSQSALTINDCTITGNIGNGIFGRLGVTLVDSVVSDNTGIGVYSPFGDVLLDNSTISGNMNGGIVAGRTNYFQYGYSVTLNDSVVSGNSKSAALNNHGGGILARGPVTLNHSVVSGNIAAGIGGGITATGTVTIDHSIVSENHSLDLNPSSYVDGLGGGVFAYAVTVLDSTICNNIAATGGGIYVGSLGNDGLESRGDLVVNRSSIQGNSATQNGGGIFATAGLIQIDHSTLSDNSAGEDGGGLYSGRVYTRTGSVILNQSTISGNTAAGNGGGIWAVNEAAVNQSTITENSATGFGGGLFVYGGTLSLANTIVAGNDAVGGGPDLTGLLGLAIDSHYSLIGVSDGTGLAPVAGGWPDANGNLVGGPFTYISPGLGPLADNGGPTLTHALSLYSPAVDAGNLVSIAGIDGVSWHDQRGAPFTRVFGGRIDIGVVEYLPAGFLPGDYNQDGTVNQADYSVWRNSMGMTTPPGTGADGNGDGQIDEADYQVWKSNFGATLDDLPALPLKPTASSVQAPAESSIGGASLILRPAATAEASRGFVHRSPPTSTAHRAATDDVLAAWLVRRGVERSDGRTRDDNAKQRSDFPENERAAHAFDAAFDELGVLG